MPSVVLHGRLAEQTVIDALLGRARQGLSGALVITAAATGPPTTHPT